MRLAVAMVVASLAALLTAGMVSAFVGVPPGPNAANECKNLSFCYGINGPWVIVPAHGEATFLIGCPERSAEVGAYLLGGTDARVSSKHVHVWYEGKLGAPIGVQTTQSSTAGLLFHASNDDGKQGSFQPVLGCINLKQASKRSTLSARAAPPPVGHAAKSPPQPNFRTQNVVLEPGWNRTITVSCLRSETLVGSWSAVSFGTSGPPTGLRPGAVTLRNAMAGKTASVVVRTSASVPYLIRIQAGAMCEP
jgi:hypothetical protein